MTDFYDEVNKLVNNIARGKVGKNDAEQIIEELKSKYGSDVFPSYDFHKQPMPWTKEYLHTLQKKNVTGACSEEFILHMAEVSDYISSKKKKTIIGIAVVIIIIVVLIIIMTIISIYDSNQTSWVLIKSYDFAEKVKEGEYLYDNNIERMIHV